MSTSPRQSQNPATSTVDAPRIALIGCGAIAKEYYLPALSRHTSVMDKLILVDRDGTRAQTLATEFNVNHFFTDYRRVLGQIDGAIIAVPTQLHYQLGMDFLSSGISVLCEKPLAENADKARELVKQAQATGALLAVDYLQRLIPSFAMAHELLVGGTLGELLAVRYAVGEEFKWPTVSGFYFNSDVSARGILRDRGAHVMDHICWWLGGKPHLTTAQNDSFGGSDAVAYVRFEHKRCRGEVHLSWLSTFPSRFILKCEGGMIEGDVYDYQTIMVQLGNGPKRRVKAPSREKTKGEIAAKIVTNFIEVVAKGASAVGFRP